ncbi:MAG TPA: hypothetical protein VER98_10765 [Terriglobia bacterium]|nr:hypothetical protein [Terriglobia bacterium]
MNPTRFTSGVLLAFGWCLILLLVPLLVCAQTPGGIIKKGAQGVEKGVVTGAEKTKEGAEAVGKGTKNVITGKDTNTGENRMKSTEPGTESGTSTAPSETTSEATTSEATDTERAKAGKKLPATAGELPLLGLTGVLALAGFGASKLVHRRV